MQWASGSTGIVMTQNAMVAALRTVVCRPHTPTSTRKRTYTAASACSTHHHAARYRTPRAPGFSGRGGGRG